MNFTEVEHQQMNGASRITIIKVDDSGKQQVVDYNGVAGEQHTKVLRAQNYGFSSNPPAGSEGIVIALGTRDMPVVVGSEHPDQRKTGLKPGQSIVYDAFGAEAMFDGKGGITIKKAKTLAIEMATSVSITAPNLTIKGDVTLEGNLNQTGTQTVSGAVTAPQFHGVADSALVDGDG